jgi:hypothetical protein
MPIQESANGIAFSGLLSLSSHTLLLALWPLLLALWPITSYNFGHDSWGGASIKMKAEEEDPNITGILQQNSTEMTPRV